MIYIKITEINPPNNKQFSTFTIDMYEKLKYQKTQDPTSRYFGFIST